MVVSGLENDVQYNISVSISDLPEYLGNVVTVDSALVFSEPIGSRLWSKWSNNYI